MAKPGEVPGPTEIPFAEVTFTEVMPDRAAKVDAVMTARPAALNFSRDAELAIIDASRLTVPEKNREKAKIEVSYERLRQTEDEFKRGLERDYLSALNDWRQRKREHEEKCAKVLQVFNTALGPSPLSLIRNGSFNTQSWFQA